MQEKTQKPGGTTNFQSDNEATTQPHNATNGVHTRLTASDGHQPTEPSAARHTVHTQAHHPNAVPTPVTDSNIPIQTANGLLHTAPPIFVSRKRMATLHLAHTHTCDKCCMRTLGTGSSVRATRANSHGVSPTKAVQSKIVASRSAISQNGFPTLAAECDSVGSHPTSLQISHNRTHSKRRARIIRHLFSTLHAGVRLGESRCLLVKTSVVVNISRR